MFGGKKFDFEARDLHHLKPFDPESLLGYFPALRDAEWAKLADLKAEQKTVDYSGSDKVSGGSAALLLAQRLTMFMCAQVARVRTPARLPPDAASVRKWLKNEGAALSKQVRVSTSSRSARLTMDGC